MGRTKGDAKGCIIEVYRDAFFSMKLIEVYRSPVLHGYVIEVKNLAEFPGLLRI
jgi:hypothetical protein